MEQPPPPRLVDQVAILDFGSQYSHLIARRVRELHVFCELYSCLVEPEVSFPALLESGAPRPLQGVRSRAVFLSRFVIIHYCALVMGRARPRTCPAPIPRCRYHVTFLRHSEGCAIL